MATAAKPSQQPCTESCVVSGDGRCEATGGSSGSANADAGFRGPNHPVNLLSRVIGTLIEGMDDRGTSLFHVG